MKTVFDEIYWFVPVSNPINVGSKVKFKKIKIFFYEKNIFSILKVNFILISQLYKSKHKYYVLFFNSPFFFLSLPYLKYKSKKFITYVGIDYEDLVKYNRLSNFIFWKKYYFSYLKYTLKKSDLIFARGNKILSFCKQFNNNVSITNPIGWNFKKDLNYQEFKKNLINTSKLNILFIGKVIREKGIYNLIDAFIKLKSEFPKKNLKLDIVGDGKELEKIKKNFCNISIHTHGWIDDESKIFNLLDSSSIFVCPTLPGYPEGVPRVIDEALNFSKLVVASNVGGIKEEFKDESIILYNPKNPNQLLITLRNILRNEINLDKYYQSIKSRRNKFQIASDQHIENLLN